MRALIWKFDFAWYMYWYCKRQVPWSVCWQEATACVEEMDALEDSWLPREAVHEAMSYWGD